MNLQGFLVFLNFIISILIVVSVISNKSSDNGIISMGDSVKTSSGFFNNLALRILHILIFIFIVNLILIARIGKRQPLVNLQLSDKIESKTVDSLAIESKKTPLFKAQPSEETKSSENE